MRRTALAFSLASWLVAVPFAALAGDDAGKPKPPDTPLPKFENPFFDAKVGETLRYQVKEHPEGRWTRFYEERILARTKDKVLVETVETNPAGDKVWSVLAPRSGWRPLTEKIVLPDGATWKKEREKEEVLYIGTPPTKAVRCTHRVLDEYKIPGDADSGRRLREIWYSHDLPVSGKAKEYPAQEDGERTVISWDKTLSAAECATRAERFPDTPPEKPDEPPTPPAGMDEPGMDGGMGG